MYKKLYLRSAVERLVLLNIKLQLQNDALSLNCLVTIPNLSDVIFHAKVKSNQAQTNSFILYSCYNINMFVSILWQVDFYLSPVI